MVLGHYGVALAAKRAAPQVQLGTLHFATQFLDELWPILVLAGVETVRVVPGLMAANQLDFVSYPWSHSLATALLWGALIGWVYFAARRYGRGALVIGGLVVSHWLLDLPMHRPDLPLWPGSSPKVGLGLWSSVPLTLAVELPLFAAGVAMYARSTRAIDLIGRWGFWAMVATLLAIYLGGIAGGRMQIGRAHV